MNYSLAAYRSVMVVFSVILLINFRGYAQAQQFTDGRIHHIPDALKDWQDWALWDDDTQNSPRHYDDYGVACPVWPSRLNLQVSSKGASFQLQVDVRSQAWVGLPGDVRIWPTTVLVDNVPVPVILRENAPSVLLESGRHTVIGSYSWAELPDSLQIGPSVGIIALTLNGQPVDFPTWREDGYLLFQSPPPPPSEPNFLEAQVMSILKDGLPLLMETHIFLNVSGQNREEHLGAIIPKGWKLTNVASDLPCSIDDQGKMKVQVRSGHWVVRLTSYCLDPEAPIGFDPGVKPLVPSQTIGFISNPSFRIANMADLRVIDLLQTPFINYPEWNSDLIQRRELRSLPAYVWKTSQPFHLLETMRGMGQKSRPGIAVVRHIFLNPDGQSFTDQDNISAQNQERWRLDASPDNELEGVLSEADSSQPITSGRGLLITRNPVSDNLGVELRSSQIGLVSTGIIQKIRSFAASGWDADVDSLRGELSLPPGWRLLALFGPDSVQGDWLTTWSLQDVFILMIFTLTIGRVWGTKPGLIAFFAYVLAYQEPDFPRLMWLCLLPPLLLLRYVQNPASRPYLQFWKWATVIPLIAFTANFFIEQLTGAVYPQLENQKGYVYTPLSEEIPSFELGGHVTEVFSAINSQLQVAQMSGWSPANQGQFYQSPTTPVPVPKSASNLDQDEKAKVQTGPAIPDSPWRTIEFGWSGPVDADKTVEVYLIAPWVQRLLNLVRIVSLFALGYWLLVGKKVSLKVLHGRVQRLNPALKKAVLVAVLLLLPWLTNVHADEPTDQQLALLRDRLLRPPKAFPNAAEIQSVALSIHGRILSAKMEVHAAADCAIPLPGQLPVWSPANVKIDEQPDASLNRDDGYLWVVIPKGIHTLQYDGFLPNNSEWAWTYKLKPHHIIVDAPDWTWSGVLNDGTLQEQLFFKEKEIVAAEARTSSDYGRQHEATLLQVERRLELGQVWRVFTTVRRLSKNTASTWIHLPVIPGEHPIGDYQAKDGFVDTALSEGQDKIEWVSELAHTNSVVLATRKEDTWVEKWSLTASPIWNVKASGIEPTFNDSDATLTPTWLPWPGESAQITVSRPVAVPGNTLTVQSVSYTGNSGLREMDSNLQIALQCTVGQNFYVQLPQDCKVTSLQLDGMPYPVQFDSKQNDRLVVALLPTSTQLGIAWKINAPLGFVSKLPSIHFFHSDDQGIEPVVCYNTRQSLTLPVGYLVLSTWGPLEGPAVRLWTWLLVLLGISYLICRVPLFPIGTIPTFLLAFGLSQMAISMSIIPLAWFFLVAWRGDAKFPERVKDHGLYNAIQVLLMLMTLLFLQSVFRQ